MSVPARAAGSESKLRTTGWAWCSAACALALVLLCCGCASRPLQGVLVPIAQSGEGTSRVVILAATTRARATDDAGAMFGPDLASDISYASITVSIPPDSNRKIGEVQWPTTLPGDPSQNFVTVARNYLDRKAFSASVSQAIKQAARRKVMVFVHGFNNRFDEAVYRFAQVVHDSNTPAIPVVFSWPSRGEISLRAYYSDRDAARNSRDALVRLLNELAANRNVSEITLLCHSMGCWLSLQAIEASAGRAGTLNPKIKNILFVAPDVALVEFQKWLAHSGRSRPRIALFVSKDDQALKLSRSIWGGERRLGDLNSDEEPYRSEFAQDGILGPRLIRSTI